MTILKKRVSGTKSPIIAPTYPKSPIKLGGRGDGGQIPLNLGPTFSRRLGPYGPANWFRISHGIQLISGDFVKKIWFFGFFLFRHARGAVRVLKTLRKHHKWKDHNFLHRIYIQKKFSTPKNIFSRSIWKKKVGFFENFENFPKSRKNQNFHKTFF